MRLVGVGAEKPADKRADTKLKKELKELKAENEALKAENEQLKAVNEALKAEKYERWEW